MPSLLWAFLRRRYVLESSYDLQSRSGPRHDCRGSCGAGCECYVGLDVVSGGLRKEGWSKTNHDESRSSFSRRTGGASHFLGPPLVFLLPKILRRARTDSSCPRVLPPPSSAGMAWIVLDLRVHVVSGALHFVVQPCAVSIGLTPGSSFGTTLVICRRGTLIDVVAPASIPSNRMAIIVLFVVLGTIAGP